MRSMLFTGYLSEVCPWYVARAHVVYSCQSKCVHGMLQGLIFCHAVNQSVSMECCEPSAVNQGVYMECY